MSEAIPAVELRIADNAHEASAGLLLLTSVLERLGNAVKNGLGLDKVANGIKSINTAINEGVSEENVKRLERVSGIIEKLGGSGGVKVNFKVAEGTRELDNVKAKVEETAAAAKAVVHELDEAFGGQLTTGTTTALEETNDAIVEVNNSVNGMEDVHQKVEDTINDTVVAVNKSQQSFAELADKYVNATSRADLLRMKISGLNEELTKGVENGWSDTRIANYAMRIQDLQEKLSKLERAEAAASEAANEGSKDVGTRLRELFAGSEKARRSHNGLLSSFARIAKYRAMRAIIKSITDGFREGVQNVREYSKAIDGHFAAAMDTADNALLKMKNSIGASVAPLIEMLVPALQTVVSWVISLVNWINQLLALLNGQSSWTKAVDASAASLKDVKKNASGAGKEIKNLLADFDELNIIQSQGGGGGGGSGLADSTAYKKMFIEVQNFEERIQRIAKFIRDHMDAIKDAAITAGIAIAAWNFSNSFSGVLSTITGLVATGATIALVFELSTVMMSEYMNTGNDAWLIANALTAAVGGTIASKIAKKIGLGAAAKYVLPVTLFVSAIADIMTNIGRTDVSALDEKSVKAAILDAAKVGTAVGISVFELGQGAVSVGEAIGFGAGAALITFGAVIGLKAVANAVASDSFESPDYVKATAFASVMQGLGAGMSIGIYARSLMPTIFGGVGGALLSLGVYTGIRAVAGAVKTGETKSSFKKYALASLEMALGSALTVGSLFGVSTGMIAGAAVGLAGLGIMVAATVYLQAKAKDAVHWGTLHPPIEAIQEFVKNQMIPIAPEVTIDLLNNTITGIETVKSNIRSSVANLTVAINKLKFKIGDKADAIKDIKEQIWGNEENGTTGLLGEVRTMAAQQKSLIAASISLVPVIDENGKDISQELAQTGDTGWSGIEDWFYQKGEMLSTAMKGGIVEGYEGTADEIVQKITQELNDASLILTQSQGAGKMYGFMIERLDQLDQGAFGDAIKIYEDAVAEQAANYKRAYLNTIESYYTAAEFYERTGNAGMADTMRKAAEEYKKNMDTSVAAAMAGYEESGKRLLREWLDQYVNGGLNFDDWGANKGFGNLLLEQFLDLDNADKNIDGFAQALRTVIESEFKIPVSVLDLLNISGWDLLSDDVKESVLKAFKETQGYVPDDVLAFLFGGNKTNTEYTPYGQYITEQYEKTAALKAEVESLGSVQVTANTIDLSGIDNPVEATTGKVINLYEALKSVAAFAGMPMSSWIGRGKHINPRSSILPFASGGFPETGQVFLSRESGPELVGTINGKTAVANNDQIVAGVASGVAAGQAEQNALLRQQNEYLRALLNKESTVKIEPSSALGKVVRRSEAMYARNAGY